MTAREFVEHMAVSQAGRPRFVVRRKERVGDGMIDVTEAVVSDDGRLCLSNGEIAPEDRPAFFAWCRQVFPEG